jgi:hypothetical protein
MEDGNKQMKQHIAAESPYTRGDVTIIPVSQTRTTSGSGWYAAEKEPLGVLVYSGTSLRIVSFTGSYEWWEYLTKEYPVLQAIHPVFPDVTSKMPKN